MQICYPVSGIIITDDLFRLFRVYYLFWGRQSLYLACSFSFTNQQTKFF